MADLRSYSQDWTTDMVGQWMRNARRHTRNQPEDESEPVTRDELDAFSGQIDGRLTAMTADLTHVLAEFGSLEAKFKAHAAAVADDIESVNTALRTGLGKLEDEMFRFQTLVFDHFSAMRAELDDLRERRPSADSPSLLEVTQHLARLVAETNLPIRWVEQPAVRRVAAALAPGMPMPSARDVRETLIALADEYRTNFTCDTEEGAFSVLMIDGAHMAGRQWLGVCIATSRGVSFCRAKTMVNQTAVQISKALVEVVEELKHNGITVVAIVSDNARNEIAGIRELGLAIKKPVFRIPCLSHTLSLALQDALAAMFPGVAFFGEMMCLFEKLPKRNKGDLFYGIHSPCPTRWLSLKPFLETVKAKKAEIRRLLLTPDRSRPPADTRNSSRQRSPLVILDAYDWPGLCACFTAIDEFIRWTEGHDASVAKAWQASFTAFAALDDLTAHGNKFSQNLKQSIYNRLVNTADLGLLILGYLITSDGLVWYRGLPATSPVPGFTKALVDFMILPLLFQFRGILSADGVAFLKEWKLYLQAAPLHEPGTTREFWTELRASEGCSPRGHLAQMALILLMMPVSEAEVERLFSRMRFIFGDRSRRTLEDLIEARLMLQINAPRDRLPLSNALERLALEPLSPLVVQARERAAPRLGCQLTIPQLAQALEAPPR
jgi:hypothetical protein